jgi:Domain of unknown function (DUF4259)
MARQESTNTERNTHTMGAWDTGPFDNDDASDWLYDLENATDSGLIEAALRGVTEAGEDELEAADCCCALAAAELVAALRGQPPGKLPETADAWLEANEGMDVDSLVKTALTAVARIRKNSELKDQWEESADTAAWYASLDDVTQRLKS